MLRPICLTPTMLATDTTTLNHAHTSPKRSLPVKQGLKALNSIKSPNILSF